MLGVQHVLTHLSSSFRPGQHYAMKMQGAGAQPSSMSRWWAAQCSHQPPHTPSSLCCYPCHTHTRIHAGRHCTPPPHPLPPTLSYYPCHTGHACNEIPPLPQRACPAMDSLALGRGCSYSSPYPTTRGLAVLGRKVHSARSLSSSSARSRASLAAAFSALASSSTVLPCSSTQAGGCGCLTL